MSGVASRKSTPPTRLTDDPPPPPKFQELAVVPVNAPVVKLKVQPTHVAVTPLLAGVPIPTILVTEMFDPTSGSEAPPAYETLPLLGARIAKSITPACAGARDRDRDKTSPIPTFMARTKNRAFHRVLFM
jgi:hypothetical protein